jgi:hypothetical protein
MSYTLASGVQPGGVDNVPRSLLLGLPIIALILSFGAIHHRNSFEPPVSAKSIPIAAKSIQPGGAKNNTSKPGTPSGGPGGSSSPSLGGGGGSLTVSSGGSGLGAASGTGSSLGSSTVAPTGGTGGGGGTATGGGTTSGGTTSGGGTAGGTGGGGTSLPTCSIGQIATVNCEVPACSPPAFLTAGQKAILGLDGTCLIVN